MGFLGWLFGGNKTKLTTSPQQIQQEDRIAELCRITNAGIAEEVSRIDTMTTDS